MCSSDLTDIFENNKSRKYNKISLSGFVVGSKKIYLSSNSGKLLQIDIGNGKVSSIFKLSKGNISEPFVNNGKMFIIKNNEIIKLN